MNKTIGALVSIALSMQMIDQADGGLRIPSLSAKWLQNLSLGNCRVGPDAF